MAQHYLYRITNLINKKIYIGARTYNGKDVSKDKYFGSGTALHYAIKKYGKLNFTKDILCLFSSRELLFLMLSVIVNLLFRNRPDTYNISLGGVIPSGMIGRKHSELTKKKMSEKQKLRIDTDLTRKIKSLSAKKRIYNHPCSQLAKLKLRQKSLLQWQTKRDKMMINRNGGRRPTKEL